MYRGFESPLSARCLQLLELEEIRLRFKPSDWAVRLPQCYPNCRNSSHLGVSPREGHQWVAAANLIDLPKLPESPRDRFRPVLSAASSVQRSAKPLLGIASEDREPERIDEALNVLHLYIYISPLPCLEHEPGETLDPAAFGSIV